MKKGYWVVAYRGVGDQAMMSRYLELAGAALHPFGARLLVSPMNAVTSQRRLTAGYCGCLSMLQKQPKRSSGLVCSRPKMLLDLPRE